MQNRDILAEAAEVAEEAEKYYRSLENPEERAIILRSVLRDVEKDLARTRDVIGTAVAWARAYPEFAHEIVTHVRLLLRCN